MVTMNMLYKIFGLGGVPGLSLGSAHSLPKTGGSRSRYLTLPRSGRKNI